MTLSRRRRLAILGNQKLFRLVRIAVGAEKTNAAVPMILITKENRDSQYVNNSYKIMLLFGIENKASKSLLIVLDAVKRGMVNH